MKFNSILFVLRQRMQLHNLLFTQHFETTGILFVGKRKKARAFPFPVWTDVLYMAAARLVS